MSRVSNGLKSHQFSSLPSTISGHCIILSHFFLGSFIHLGAAGARFSALRTWVCPLSALGQLDRSPRLEPLEHVLSFPATPSPGLRIRWSLWSLIYKAFGADAKAVIKGSKRCALSSQEGAESEKNSHETVATTHTKESNQDAKTTEVVKDKSAHLRPQLLLLAEL